MTALLKKLIRGDKSRESYGKLAGWVGIISNFILFLVKLLVGYISNSISIMTDAINNLSDSTASVITIMGFKMSEKPPDEEHPYGHARFEYISGLLVSCIVFVIGAQFFINSLKKTISPEETNFNWILGILLIISILVKVWQSAFNKKLGQEIDSQVLIATAVDSRNDVITAIVVLMSSIIQHYFRWKLDGPIGMAVSLFVIYSGIQLLKDTLTPLLGEAPDKELVSEIVSKIKTYPSVVGVHDLIVHNYGPNNLFVSVHVEVPAKQDILISHEIIDDIERDCNKDLGIEMVVHLDPVVTDDPLTNQLHELVNEISKEISPEIFVHDFRTVKGTGRIRMIFDIAVPLEFDLSNKAIRKKYNDELYKVNSQYEAVITIDRNFSTFYE